MLITFNYHEITKYNPLFIWPKLVFSSELYYIIQGHRIILISICNNTVQVKEQ